VLSCIRIAQLAIVDTVEVDFGRGLNVITGETGAGKSILVTALKLLLGARARPDAVRGGAEQAEVEALFVDHGSGARLAALGLPDDDELVIRRVIQSGGRSRAYVNGSLATASQLAALASGLVDISSQHEHHTLVDASTHLAWLDAFSELGGLAQRMSDLYGALASLSRDLEREREQAAERASREDLLRWQIDEIDRTSPRVGEESALADEIGRLRHVARLQSVAVAAEDALVAGQGTVGTRLARAIVDLRDAAHIDGSLGAFADRLESVRAEVDDIARDLGRYARRSHADPSRLAEAEERLQALRRLARKYGGELEAVLAHRAVAERALASFDGVEERIEGLAARVSAARDEALIVAKELSARRLDHATRLGDAISGELGSLGMGGARVLVDVAPLDGLGGLDVGGHRIAAHGLDRVEFLIAPNRGEEPRPLKKVASGGELSRALLALKRVLAGLGNHRGTWVFDEVDTGVGGAVGEVLGRKLGEIARHHQVLCITHLPQVASLGDTHLRVQKHEVDGRTVSTIVQLDPGRRLDEIARMLGGLRVSETTRRAAAEMLQAGAVR
jgi:DNA repair protein RecN (Recombination protein N)